MKKLLIPAMLLAAASAYGVTSDGLTTATGDRLTDYTNWFTPEFNVSSDANYVGVPYPRWNMPDAVAMDTINRDWSGWTQNWGVPALGGPIIGVAKDSGLVTKVEFAFLGETAGWWNDIGYRLNGVDHLLADGIQTFGATNREFGDYFEMTLKEGDTLDFFVTGSGAFAQDGVITTGTTGGKFYVFDEALNQPLSASTQSYFGTLAPVTGAQWAGLDADVYLTDQSFTVMGFEDIRIRAGSDQDYNDVLFAFRRENLRLTGTVPEPSTYGLIGAAALLALAGYRRFKKA